MAITYYFLYVLLFMSMGWDVSVHRPPTSVLFIYQVIYVYDELRWNNIDRRKPKNSEINPCQCYFFRHKSYMDRPGREPGLRRERPATNCLSHGTAVA